MGEARTARVPSTSTSAQFNATSIVAWSLLDVVINADAIQVKKVSITNSSTSNSELRSALYHSSTNAIFAGSAHDQVLNANPKHVTGSSIAISTISGSLPRKASGK